MSPVKNTLRELRQQARLTQDELARSAGMSRQAYLAIEQGRSIPSTELALRLARALRESVERLFSLEDDVPTIHVEVREDVPLGARVRLVHTRNEVVAKPLEGPRSASHTFQPAEGTAAVAGNATSGLQVRLLGDIQGSHAIVLAGCDPSVSIFKAILRERGLDLATSEESSGAALQALARGEAHIAGCHLRDAAGGYNSRWVEDLVPFPCTLISFAVWRQGLVLQAGNPKHIEAMEDLGREDVSVVNRQVGSGARALLDLHLGRIGLSSTQIHGYDRWVNGHLTLAEVVAGGLADCGVGVEAAAIGLGLEFLPLAEERYDLVIPDRFLNMPQVQRILEVLRGPRLREAVEALGGYDGATMGLPA